MIHPQDIAPEELFSFVSDFPALLWRIDITKAQISLLNTNTDVAPGIDGALLLKNMGYRNQVVLPRDRDRVESFIGALRDGKESATVFRVRDVHGEIAWLKLTGALNKKEPRYYYGYLLNVNDTASVIKGELNPEGGYGMLIEELPQPAFLMDLTHHHLICANGSARSVLGFSDNDLGNLDLTRMFPDQQFYDPGLSPGERTGTSLTFSVIGADKVVTAEVTLKKIMVGQRAFLLFLLEEFAETPLDKPESLAQVYSTGDLDELKAALEQQTDIQAILNTCMNHPLFESFGDAFLFSDVHIRKNRVKVYGAGEPFEKRNYDQEHPFEGTIADDINRYDLPFLQVDDTHDSIKPIDWALFVPMGIRSYFAFPFHSRRVLRSVLILCSDRPEFYAGHKAESFLPILEIVEQAIRKWRRSHRL